MFTRGHNTVSLEEIKQSDKPTGAKSLQKVQYCKDHEDEVLKLFCKTCKKVICRDCALVKHRDHDYTFIREVRPEIQQQLEALIKEVQAKEVEYKSHIDYLENVRGIGTDTLATCKHKVNKTCDQLKEAIESRRAALIAQLHEIHDSEKKQVDLEAEGLQSTLSKLSNSIGFTQQLLANGSDVEVVSMSVQAVQTLEGLKTVKWNKNTIKPTLMRVTFDPEFEENVNKFGTTSHEIKPDDLLVKLPNKTTNVGQEIKFEVHLSKEISERGYDATSELIVKLTHTTDNAGTVCKPCKTKLNTWEVSYVPKTAGDYQVSAVLDNVESAPSILCAKQPQVVSSYISYGKHIPPKLPLKSPQSQLACSARYAYERTPSSSPSPPELPVSVPADLPALLISVPADLLPPISVPADLPPTISAPADLPPPISVPADLPPTISVPADLPPPISVPADLPPLISVPADLPSPISVPADLPPPPPRGVYLGSQVNIFAPPHPASLSTQALGPPHPALLSTKTRFASPHPASLSTKTRYASPPIGKKKGRGRETYHQTVNY